MLGSSKKKLLVSGCSFTASGENSFIPFDGIPFDKNCEKWPEIVAEKLNLELVNLARCGKGNKFISNSIMDYIMCNDPNDIELVLIGWSQFERYEFTNHENISDLSVSAGFIDVMSYGKGDPEPNRNTFSWLRKVFHFIKFIRNHQITTIFDDFREFYITQEFLKSRNIKYKFFFGPPPMFYQTIHIPWDMEVEEYLTIENRKLKNKNYHDVFLRLIDNVYYKNIDTDNFYNFPGLKELGGKPLVEFDWKYGKSVINSLSRSKENGYKADSHPNERGHREMAERVLKIL